MLSAFLGTFKEKGGVLLSKSQPLEIVPNPGDIEIYVSWQRTKLPYFMQSKDIFDKIMKKILEK
jgi:hypothetical protein